MKRGKLMAFINAVKKVRDSLDDDLAMAVGAFYPEWSPDREYKVGERLVHNGQLYKVLLAHTAQQAWTPDAAPSLFAAVLPGQDGTIGEWAQPDSANPYMQGDRVMYNGHLYESDYNYNVWRPDEFGWKLLD